MMITYSKIIKAVITLGNYLDAIGGSNDEGDLRTVERYDVLSNI